MAEPNRTDQELLESMQAGDEQAFVELYRRRQAGVYRFALHMSGSRPVAEDVTQEVFLFLMRRGSRYDFSRGSLAAFLAGVARNLVLKHLERERAHVPDNDAVAEEALPAESRNPADELVRKERVDRLRQAVLALPVHYREALVLCDLQEMTYAGAAQALRCSVGTVRSRLHRARAMRRNGWGQGSSRLWRRGESIRRGVRYEVPCV